MIDSDGATAQPLGNVGAARHILAIAREAGVQHVAVCAGSRNAPLLVAVADARALDVVSFVDERAAAFFALGRARATGHPAAVITTSGTAVAELLPAVVEAHYSGIPLLLITADRPPRFRGTGAPQSIEQPGIFGVYVERSIDIDAAHASTLQLSWSRMRPLHLNVCFDEPLIDELLIGAPVADARLNDATNRSLAIPSIRTQRSSPAVDWQPLLALLTRSARPLVLIGELAAEDAKPVLDFVQRVGCAVYAEPLSGLRGHAALATQRLDAGERVIGRGAFDAVVRIGRIPTLRFWRDLEESARDIPVVSVDRLPFAGLTRGSLIVADLQSLPTLDVPRRVANEAFIAFDRERRYAIDALLDGEPRSELALVRALSRVLPDGSHLFLGNSLPIREWDLAATRDSQNVRCTANRGANGIDGELSTFFGESSPARPNVCLLGDLTALYDLNAPWVVPQLAPGTRFTIVIVNNGGGRIFARVPSLAPLGRASRERIIENVHALRFEHFAAMWQLDYVASDALTLPLDANARRVVELLPDAEASQRVWDHYDQLWSPA